MRISDWSSDVCSSDLWLFARAADAVEHARQRNIVDVVPGRLRIGTILSPAGHAPIDEPGIVGEQHLGAKAEPLHHAGPIALDDAVGALAQIARGGELGRASCRERVWQ